MVYLIHFTHPVHHAKHYIGYTEDLRDRFTKHEAGNGARLTEVAGERGSHLQLARIWISGDRAFERKLKDSKNGPRFCPICNPDTAMNHEEKRS